MNLDHQVPVRFAAILDLKVRKLQNIVGFRYWMTAKQVSESCFQVLLAVLVSFRKPLQKAYSVFQSAEHDGDKNFSLASSLPKDFSHSKPAH